MMMAGFPAACSDIHRGDIRGMIGQKGAPYLALRSSSPAMYLATLD
jgi:hypothetical protein